MTRDGSTDGVKGREQTQALNGELRDGCMGAIFTAIASEVRRIAAAQLRTVGGPRRGNGIDLTITCLVQDVWVKLRGTQRWDSRSHFYGAASRAARQVIVEWLRKYRGNGPRYAQLGQIDIDPAAVMRRAEVDLIEIVDAVIAELETSNPRIARVLEMKLFGELPSQLIAEVLATSERTVERDWAFARGRLAERLREDP